ASNSFVPTIVLTAPDAPLIGSATRGVAAISVVFAAPATDGGSPITNYTATCDSSDGGAPGAASGTARPVVVPPLTNGRTYTCTVDATNAIGTSAESAESNAVVPATVPGKPVIGTATGGSHSVSVAFTAPANDGGSPITNYTATCTSSDGGTTGTASGASSPVVVNALTSGKTYVCWVVAANAVGSGSASTSSNAVVLDVTVPNA